MMKSILIIEDDITFGMMLKTWLGKKGFEVSSVSNIARAQKHIEGQGADLILSDLRLPDHDGIDLLKWMNEKGNRYTFDYYDRLCRYPIGSAGYETGST